jgi:hypothetical protein
VPRCPGWSTERNHCPGEPCRPAQFPPRRGPSADPNSTAGAVSVPQVGLICIKLSQGINPHAFRTTRDTLLFVISLVWCAAILARISHAILAQCADLAR